VVEKMEGLTPDDCGISAVTAFELFAGAARAHDPGREAVKIQKLVGVIHELPFDAHAARRAGALRSELEEAGTSIGPYDLLIAAHALALDLALISTNRREFGRVAGLRLTSWR
jgi:tRNA(fMet)-specific endonuclease VapC